MPNAPEPDTNNGDLSKAIEARRNDEYSRLRKQHNLHKAVLDNKLVRVPLPTDKPILILDTATGDGTWLLDAVKEYSNATFVGTDIHPRHFEQYPKEKIPSNVSFKVQSLLDEWPEEDKRKYDLVHQRYCLPLFNKNQDVEIVGRLLELVKPGGYIQIIESDMTSFEKGPEHKGMEAFMEFVVKAFPQVNMYPSPGPNLKGWLEDLGATDVKEEVFSFKMGATAMDEVFRKDTTEYVADMIDNFSAVAAKMPNYWFSQEQFQELKKAVLEEMDTTGNTWKFWLVTARKTGQLLD